MESINKRRDEVVVFPNDDSPKLFENKILETLTKTHPAVIFIMYAIISGVLIRYYYIHIESNAYLITGLFFTGLFSWTFAEYMMHRFLYHKLKDATYNTGIQYLFHGIHHRHPHDKSRLILPPIPSLIMGFIFFCIFYLLMNKYAFIFLPGFAIGYSIYMTIHYATHILPPPNNVFKYIWTHHNIHHYQQHDKAFGVTTPFWDYIFGTMPIKGRKTVKIIYKKNQ